MIVKVIVGLLFFGSSFVAQADSKMVMVSWYGGPDFDGKFMANSQRFYSTDPTIAANWRLPFGTKLLLENPENLRKLVVIVKDRGPHPKTGRYLDLSRAGAKSLGFAEKGVTQLKVTVID